MTPRETEADARIEIDGLLRQAEFDEASGRHRLRARFTLA